MGYLSDPHKARSQTCYLFTCGGNVISCHFVKQTLVATYSNHAEIIAIYKASHECIWLRNLTQHICKNCGLTSNRDVPTILYEDNTTCIAPFKEGFIKGDRTKHISPKFFSLMIFKKSVTSTSRKFNPVTTFLIGLLKHFLHRNLKRWYETLLCGASRKSSDVLIRGSWKHIVLFSLAMFFPLGFLSKVFNEAIVSNIYY